MNTQELAKAFTDMCAKGEFDAAGKKFWSDDIVSFRPTRVVLNASPSAQSKLQLRGLLPMIGISIGAIRIWEVDSRTKRIGRSAPRIERWHP